MTGLVPLALILVSALIEPARTAVHDFEFVTIIDVQTSVPGGHGTFSIFGAPSIDGDGNLVFCGRSDVDAPGIYAVVRGSLRVVADASTPIPGQDTTFAHGFRSYGASIDQGNIAFYAFTQSTELGGGVYLWKDGAVDLVADGNTPVPGGTATFNSIEDPLGFGPFSHPPISGVDVAFRAAADNPRQRGVYVRVGGTLDVVADLNDPVPDGIGDFTFLGADITIANGKVAFRGEGKEFQRGIYTNLTGPLTKVVDTTDSIPGGTGHFTSVEYPLFDGSTILFPGEGADGQQGIYVWDGGSISKVVDRGTPIPDGAGTFTGFAFNVSQLCADGGDVVFPDWDPTDRRAST